MKRDFFKDSTGAIAFETSAPSADYILTTGEENKILWMAKYQERRDDGDQYYNKVQSELWIKHLKGDYTITEISDFEEHTKPIANLLTNGNWIKAQAVCSALPFSGIFDADKKNEIQQRINDYVNLYY